jgi:hypothetical protein
MNWNILLARPAQVAPGEPRASASIWSGGWPAPYMAMATDTRAVGQAAALAIGSTVALEALFAGPMSGASMNPARSLAPALVSFTWTAQWVYLVAPLLRAIVGALVYRWLRQAGQPVAQSKSEEHVS